ncbi:uncharacterized protein [Musca autumnalis]|uniref:uncharacterized protein n=1 Tax=Musca autumnalis TaxID=221902 RepID=UPI003CE6BB4A
MSRLRIEAGNTPQSNNRPPQVQPTPISQMPTLPDVEEQTLRDLFGIQSNNLNRDRRASGNNHGNPPPALQSQDSGASGASNLTDRPDKVLQIISNWKIKFTGGSTGLSVENFIYRVEALIAQTLNGNNNILCKNVSALFDGKANDRYWRYHRTVQTITWPGLCEALRMHYKDSRTDVDIRELIGDRRQKPAESFDLFYDSIVDLTDRLSEPISERTLVEILRRNLLPEIQHEILNLDLDMGRTQFTRGLLEFQFEIDDGNCAIKWNSWLRGFELFATANRITDCDEKYSWLLHYAGTKVQEVFFNLPHTEDYVKRGPLIGGFIPHLNKYDDGVMKLQNFFAPKRNATYERHIFRKMKQEPNERIELFAVRLRTQAERCNFGNQIESNIKDQITEACSSDLLRRKILERGDDSLDEILKMARIIEAVSEQQKSFRTSNQDMRKRQFRSNQNNRFECYRCGTKGHKANDNRCPAKGKECSKCGGKNHFARKCMTTNIRKRKRNEHYDENDSRYKSLNRATGNYETKRVQMVSSMEEYDDNADDNVFCISTSDSSNEIRCQIGGVETTAIIDSGSKYNVVDRENWMDLKSKNVNVIGRQKQTDKTFTAYGGKPLKLMGLFKAMVQIDGRSTIADFYVVDEKGKLLLGRDTAMCLQVLKIGNNINQVTRKTDDHQLGKIAGIIVHIPIKENVKPIVQPYRRIPAPLEEAVDKKIQEMLRQGIIEKVNGPSKWVSPVVVVPKRDDIRLCVDMRRANEAVSRENHPLTTIDDFLPHIGTGKFFSKLDIKQAFHQVEIAPDSREITTFITKRGLYRYTRLMFGITCAPEIFQKIMEQVLNGCDGCLNFIDDIIVYAETKNEHDRRLKKVFDRLRKFNVTLNIKNVSLEFQSLSFLAIDCRQTGSHLRLIKWMPSNGSENLRHLKSHRPQTTGDNLRTEIEAMCTDRTMGIEITIIPIQANIEITGERCEDSDYYVNWLLSHVTPKAMKLQEIVQASDNDHEIQAVRNAIMNQEWVGAAESYKVYETELSFADRILLRGTRIVIPSDLRSRVLDLAHEGHPGMTIMKRRLRAKVWWPRIDQNVEAMVKRCQGCTLVSIPSNPEPIRRTELPSEPWQHLEVDFCGPLPSGHHLFVIVDYYSRFMEVEIMTKIDTMETINRLEIIFARFGFPVSITADNGPQFGAEFRNYCEINNIKLINTTPYWPQQNGEVERQNRSLLKVLKISQATKSNWKAELLKYLLMYRSTPHSTTLKSPAELMFNRKIRDKLPTITQPLEIDEELHDRDKEQKEKESINESSFNPLVNEGNKSKPCARTTGNQSPSIVLPTGDLGSPQQGRLLPAKRRCQKPIRFQEYRM